MYRRLLGTTQECVVEAVMGGNLRRHKFSKVLYYVTFI